MSMSASHLSAAIRSALAGKPWINNSSELTELCDAIATAVVDEVKLALITVPAGTAGLGVTTGLGSPIGPTIAPVPIAGSIS
jgi:hypothetical protein